MQQRLPQPQPDRSSLWKRLIARAKPSDAELEKRAINYKQYVTGLITLGLACISGVWTFEGSYQLTERVGGDTFQTVIVAGLIALGVTGAQVTAWWVLIGTIPTLKPGRRLTLGVILTAALQLWTFAVSSTNNVIALTGGPSLIKALQGQHADYTRAVELATARALAIKPYLGILEGEAEGRCRQLRSEVEGGMLTGARGPGAVSGTLELLCAQSRQNAALIRQAVETSEGRAREIQEILSAMDGTLYDTSREIFERETAFLQLATKADGWLRRTKADDMSQVLRTSHKAMASSVSTLPTDDSALGSRQSAIIAGLKGSIEETGQIYARVADELDMLPPVVVPEAGRVSIVRAVWDAAGHHLPSVAAAAGIDLFQIFMVFNFILARDPPKTRSKSKSKRRPPLSLKD